MNDEELLKKLRETFKLEAQERLSSISSEMLKLEKTFEPDEQKSIIEVVYREAHSLKGAARSVDLRDIETIFQQIESVFSSLIEGQIKVSPDLFDTIYSTLRTIENFLSLFDQDPFFLENEETAGLIEKLKDYKNDQGKKEKNLKTQKGSGSQPKRKQVKPAIDQERPVISETIRISASRLNSLLLKAEEMVSVKLMLDQHCTELGNIMQIFSQWKKRYSTVDLDLRALQNQLRKEDHYEIKKSSIAKLYEFLQWNQEIIQSLKKEIGILTKTAKGDHHIFSKNVDGLLEDMKEVMMLPFASLLDIFPRMARDISREQGKEVEIIIQGQEVEIDRRILEEIKDPLIHIVRNSIDHGIETPQERIEKKKPPKGTIELIISQNEGNKIDILFSDDGRGINIDHIKEQAVKLGILEKRDADNLKDQEALKLIFQSGLSTSHEITHISGRGLGMAIVCEKVEKLGGLLSIKTNPGQGTSFKIQLPVTLASFKGILLKVAERLFIVPSSHVEYILRIRPQEVKTIENKATLSFKHQIISFVDLADVLALDRGKDQQEKRTFMTAIVIEDGEKKIAFKVDEILNQQEVLVKSLGKHLKKIHNITGATILGTGKVVPILKIQDMLKSAGGISISAPKSSVGGEKEEKRKKSILIAEDSITSRMLIKNILEAGGYLVKTTVDGSEAYRALKTQSFDAVVSDIEMPRMNGFELTKKIRSEPKLTEIPVVLISSLESREDKEKGIDAGADAYIVKSNFDRNNLLEVIERLV